MEALLKDIGYENISYELHETNDAGVLAVDSLIGKIVD